MNWKNYEEITKYIYETLGSETGIKIVGYGHTCKVKGKSGVDHQIDVLTSLSDGINNSLTAIECKYWKKKIDKDVVMKLAAIIEDADIHKGVIVSKKGVTKDGESFARYKNIGLVKLNEIEEREQKEEERNPSFTFAELIVDIKAKIRRPQITAITIDFINPKQKIDINNHYQLTLRLNDGRKLRFDDYVMNFKEKLHEEELDKIVEKYYGFKEVSLINKVTKEEVQISGFTLEGKLTLKNESTKREFELVDEVWMKMKALFENNSYSISRLGMIKKDIDQAI